MLHKDTKFLTPPAKYLWWVCSGIAFAIIRIRKSAKPQSLVPEHCESTNCEGLCMYRSDAHCCPNAQCNMLHWDHQGHPPSLPSAGGSTDDFFPLFRRTRKVTGEMPSIRSPVENHVRNVLRQVGEKYPHPVCQLKGWAGWHSSPWWETTEYCGKLRRTGAQQGFSFFSRLHPICLFCVLLIWFCLGLTFCSGRDSIAGTSEWTGLHPRERVPARRLSQHCMVMNLHWGKKGPRSQSCNWICEEGSDYEGLFRGN